MKRKRISVAGTVEFLTVATILAWAAQTMLAPLARGQDAMSIRPNVSAGEKFVPEATRVGGGATVELRGEANVPTAEVKLQQICRWSDADASIMAPLADLIVARFSGSTPFQSVSLEDLRKTLGDAGANLGHIRFAGATACTVGRTDLKYDESAALQNWVDAKEGRAPAKPPLDLTALVSATAPASVPATAPTTSALPLVGAPAADAATAAARLSPANSGVRTLRDLIIADAAVRLKVPIDTLQMNFNPVDEKLLNLCEPQFKFYLTARRVFGLGEVAWDVLVATDTVNKKFSITATARAWQMQVVLVRPVACRQVIESEDVSEKRVLSDRLPDDPLLAMAQCVGQEASRELKPGTVLTAPMVSPATLSRPGQLITVTLSTGSIRIKTVARALEAGSYGQCIKVRPEGGKDPYDVVLTGPQEGTMSPVPPQ